MSHTYTRIYIHLIFSTKHRAAMIKKDIQPRLWRYMAAVCREKGIISKEIGGLDNHAHVLFHLPPTMTLSKAVYLIKANSSRWMKQFVGHFGWQEGYGAFSVSASNLEPVIKYIRNQGSYHKKMTFEREYLAFLKKHGVEFDPRYVFD